MTSMPLPVKILYRLITSEYKGYPISGIEALVHGRPVIVLNTFPAARDLVKDHVSGLVLNDFSPEALAYAIIEIFATPQDFREGALRHRELFASEKARHDWRKLLLADSNDPHTAAETGK